MSGKKLSVDVRNGRLELTTIRGFTVTDESTDHGSGAIVLCGTDDHNHDVWFVQKKKAHLVGVLNQADMKKLRRTKNLNLAVSDSAFAFFEKTFSKAVFVGRVDEFSPEGIYSSPN